MDDWRLIGNFDNIIGCNFKKERFISTLNNYHEHCEFCGIIITDLNIQEEHLDSGYMMYSKKNKQTKWVCEKCFNDFKDMFGFKESNELMLIPKHLEEISAIAKISDSRKIVKIKCKCNHCLFKVYEFIENNNNINNKLNFDKTINEERVYWIKRNFFGKVIEKKESESRDSKKTRRIIKVKCEKCGLEHVLFDNYKHGYEASTTNKENNILDKNKNLTYKQIYLEPLEIYLRIDYNISYKQFQNKFINVDYYNYLNSFSYINIYGINSKSKKLKIYSEKTS